MVSCTTASTTVTTSSRCTVMLIPTVNGEGAHPRTEHGAEAEAGVEARHDRGPGRRSTAAPSTFIATSQGPDVDAVEEYRDRH